MGNNNASIKKSYEEAIAQLSSVQLSKIIDAYKELHSRGGKKGGLVDRSLFASFFDVSPVLSERLFETFDRKKNGLVDLEEFVCGVTLMLHGSFEDKCGLLFDVFNVAGDEGVSYEELTCILSAIAVNTDLMLTTFHHPSSSALLEPETSQQAVKRIADAAFEKCDITGTGKLLPLEFRYWLEQNPEILNTLLPQGKIEASAPTEDANEVILIGQAVVNEHVVTGGHRVEVTTYHQEVVDMVNDQSFHSITSQFTEITEDLSSYSSSKEILDQDTHDQDAHDQDTHDQDTHDQDTHDQDTHDQDAHDQDTHDQDTHDQDTHDQDTHDQDTHDQDTHDQDAHDQGTNDPDKEVDDQKSVDPVSTQDVVSSQDDKVIADQGSVKSVVSTSPEIVKSQEAVLIVDQKVTGQDFDNVVDHKKEFNEAVHQEVVNSQRGDETAASQIKEVVIDHNEAIIDQDEAIIDQEVTELVTTEGMDNIQEAREDVNDQDIDVLVNDNQAPATDQSDVLSKINQPVPFLPTIDMSQGPVSPDIVDTPHHSKSLLEQDDIWQSSFILTQPSCVKCPSELRSLWREPLMDSKVTTQPLQHYMLSVNSDQVLSNVAAVSMDIAGFQELLVRGQYPAALELSGRFLTAHGQSHTTGSSLHTEQTVSMWSGRLLLLFQLGFYKECASELEHFNGFNQPDLFYQNYPNRYGNQRGSMTPFMLRLLNAELPLYCRDPNTALDRLFLLKESCEKLLSLLGDNQPDATALWRNRHAHVMLAIGNCLLSVQEYTLAIDIYKQLSDMLSERLRPTIVSAIGRIHLLLGDVGAAKECFAVAMSSQPGQEQLQNQLNRVAVMVFQSAYAEAYDLTQKMLQQHSNNLLVLNNAAVCAFYTGRQQEAMQLLQRATKLRTSEAISINMKAIYDLETSGNQSENKRRSTAQPPRV